MNLNSIQPFKKTFVPTYVLLPVTCIKYRYVRNLSWIRIETKAEFFCRSATFRFRWCNIYAFFLVQWVDYDQWN